LPSKPKAQPKKAASKAPKPSVPEFDSQTVEAYSARNIVNLSHLSVWLPRSRVDGNVSALCRTMPLMPSPWLLARLTRRRWAHARPIQWTYVCAAIVSHSGWLIRSIKTHPERRFKAAFEAYKERELPELRKDVCPRSICVGEDSTADHSSKAPRPPPPTIQRPPLQGSPEAPA
jgi:hypothetical protein